jgi:hypothetical protein
MTLQTAKKFKTVEQMSSLKNGSLNHVLKFATVGVQNSFHFEICNECQIACHSPAKAFSLNYVNQNISSKEN